MTDLNEKNCFPVSLTIPTVLTTKRSKGLNVFHKEYLLTFYFLLSIYIHINSYLHRSPHIFNYPLLLKEINKGKYILL